MSYNGSWDTYNYPTSYFPNQTHSYYSHDYSNHGGYSQQVNGSSDYNYYPPPGYSGYSQQPPNYHYTSTAPLPEKSYLPDSFPTPAQEVTTHSAIKTLPSCEKPTEKPTGTVQVQNTATTVSQSKSTENTNNLSSSKSTPGYDSDSGSDESLLDNEILDSILNKLAHEDKGIQTQLKTLVLKEVSTQWEDSVAENLQITTDSTQTDIAYPPKKKLRGLHPIPGAKPFTYHLRQIIHHATTTTVSKNSAPMEVSPSDTDSEASAETESISEEQSDQEKESSISKEIPSSAPQVTDSTSSPVQPLTISSLPSLPKEPMLPYAEYHILRRIECKKCKRNVYQKCCVTCDKDYLKQCGDFCVQTNKLLQAMYTHFISMVEHPATKNT